MKKPKQKVIQTEDSIEAFKGLPGEFQKAMAVEGRNLISGLWKQALKPSDLPETKAKEPQKTPQKAGDLRPGEELSLKEEKQVQRVEPGINYAREIIHAEKRIRTQDEHQTKVKIQEIVIEIKKLTKSSKELAVQFKDVQNLEHIPEDAGKYHANFVEWVLSMIRSAREKVDNTLSWTTALHSKRKQKQYWSLFKKHGTSFALSGERTAANQVG